jgi:hypothetical protein
MELRPSFSAQYHVHLPGHRIQPTASTRSRKPASLLQPHSVSQPCGGDFTRNLIALCSICHAKHIIDDLLRTK